MTLQEIFSTVVHHLHTQGKRAVDVSSGACVYKTQDGCMCAVGALIPARCYSISMEGHQPQDTVVQTTLTHAGVLSDDESDELRRDKVRLLVELQTIHDAFYALPDWPWSATVAKLAERGGHFNLTWPEGVPHA